MRTLIAAALLALALLPVGGGKAVEAAGPKSVGVCHLSKDDGTYRYIMVNPHALKHGHTVEKGDVLGLTREACDALNVKA